MPIENYLVQGEEILANAGIFFATNKRLIRYHKRFLSEELDDIPYSHITSLGIVRRPRRRLIKAGIAITLIAIITFLSLMVINSVLKSVSGLLKGFMGFDLSGLLAPLIPFSVILFVFGIVLILLGILVPNVYVQFFAPGLSEEAKSRFHINLPFSWRYAGSLGKSYMEGNAKDNFRRKGAYGQAVMNLVNVVRQQSLGIAPSEIASVQPQDNRGTEAPDEQKV